VLARKGTPHTYRNAGNVEAEYVLVMPPRIAALIDAIHQPDADVRPLSEGCDSVTGLPNIQVMPQPKWPHHLVVLAVAFASLCGVAMTISPTASALQARYCEKPNPNAYLIASPGVTCATAEAIKRRLISSACYTRTRCVAFGFRCVAYWESSLRPTLQLHASRPLQQRVALGRVGRRLTADLRGALDGLHSI
jgi:hypothetical protein